MAKNLYERRKIREAKKAAAPRPVRSVRWHEQNVIARAVKFADVFVTTVGFGAPLARAGGLLNDAVEGLQAARRRQKQSDSGGVKP